MKTSCAIPKWSKIEQPRHLMTYGMVGDCSRRGCGHSLMYHLPLIGCTKCDCSEYK